ncbi:MAG: hypothetical protein AB2L14_15835 [Candidatus Xenobiia bacterium LiM19]
MIIQSVDGSELEIIITGYEFSTLMKNEYDSNWLRVHGRVKSSRLSWEFIGPWFLTWEVLSLAKWLRAIAGGGTSLKNLRFIEPCLRFKLAKRLENQAILKTCFSQEGKPSSAEANNVWLDLVVTDAELIQASDSLLSELNIFPMRSARERSLPQPPYI